MNTDSVGYKMTPTQIITTNLGPIIRQKFRKDLLTCYDYSSIVKEKLVALAAKYTKRYDRLPLKRRFVMANLIERIENEIKRLQDEEADFRTKTQEKAQKFRWQTGTTVRFRRYSPDREQPDQSDDE